MLIQRKGRIVDVDPVSGKRNDLFDQDLIVVIESDDIAGAKIGTFERYDIVALIDRRGHRRTVDP